MHQFLNRGGATQPELTSRIFSRSLPKPFTRFSMYTRLNLVRRSSSSVGLGTEVLDDDAVRKDGSFRLIGGGEGVTVGGRCLGLLGA